MQLISINIDDSSRLAIPAARWWSWLAESRPKPHYMYSASCAAAGHRQNEPICSYFSGGRSVSCIVQASAGGTDLDDWRDGHRMRLW